MVSHRILFIFSSLVMLSSRILLFGQDFPDFQAKQSENNVFIKNQINFNGYTNHWHNTYTEWFRYGNLFKIGLSEVQSTMIQSKINVAEDIGLPGLLLQEGFISNLIANKYNTIEYPTFNELEGIIKRGNTLVITNPTSKIGRELEEKALPIFEWAKSIKSHQFSNVDLQVVKAFYLTNEANYLFVISSTSAEQIEKFLNQIKATKEILSTHHLHKGLFGVSSRLKSVTIEPGHPLELIGIGMNEGNSWFVFDGYMDFLAKKEIEDWVKEVKLPVVIDVGFSPIYGCVDYDGLQVQDMETTQAWIDYANEKEGYIFRPVYHPDSDNYMYDGYFVDAGNKEQIDNENIPFINRSGYLSGNLTSSMVLFIDKGKSLSKNNLWDAIMNRKTVAILDKAQFMGPAKFRHALGLLYLDKEYLEDYFYDNLDLKAETDGYNLIVTVKNYSLKMVSGNLEVIASSAIKINNLPDNITLVCGEEKQFSISLHPDKGAMGKTNPIAVTFVAGEKQKKTVTMLDLPPVISVHQLLYSNEPEVNYPVTIHNFTQNSSFPVDVSVFKINDTIKPVYSQRKTYQTETSSFNEQEFQLKLKSGNYKVKINALGVVTESQLGVGKAEGNPSIYEVDLDSDGIYEFRMENDSVMVTLLRTGARVIEYIIKSKDDNIFFKGWPEKTYNHRKPYRMRGYYPYGGFEDFLGQASMETHRVYDARIVHKEGDYVQVEMETDFFGNHLKKIFTLYGNTPLLEVKFVLKFKNPEANVIGPQPILELGKSHGTEDIFTVPTKEGIKEYRMRPEDYYGQAINISEGWNAGFDTKESIAFIGTFPVNQPIFLHMWMNHPKNTEAPHYYVEFQPWTPILLKSKTYFSYYFWGTGGDWKIGLEEMKKRNLITFK